MIIVRAILWFCALQVTINPVLKINRGTNSFWVLIMKSFNFMRCPFKSVGIIEHWIVLYTDPFDLVLQPAVPLPALKDPFDFPLWLLVIDDRQRRILVLAGQRVPWVLPQEFWSKDIVELIAIREFKAVRVSYLLDNLIGTLVLIA